MHPADATWYFSIGEQRKCIAKEFEAHPRAEHRLFQDAGSIGGLLDDFGLDLSFLASGEPTAKIDIVSTTSDVE
jgi:hypothetical protein